MNGTIMNVVCFEWTSLFISKYYFQKSLYGYVKYSIYTLRHENGVKPSKQTWGDYITSVTD